MRARVRQMEREGCTPKQICAALVITPQSVYNYLGDSVKARRSLGNCECGNLAIVKFKGKHLCASCLNPEYEHRVEARRTSNLGMV